MEQKRILLIDDNESIHNDFYKILLRGKNTSAEVDEDESIIFADSIEEKGASYRIDAALQGNEGFELVKKSLIEQDPYALAFVDIRMPPGWDGIETIQRIWEVDNNIQIVICSAHSDYSWKEITERLGNSENFLILKKPFDILEIRQLASSLTRKWELKQQVQYQINNLQDLVKERTIELEKALSLTNATLESTAEGIVVLNRDKEILQYNQNFLNTWDIKKNIINSENSELIFEKMADQVEDSPTFFKAMNNLAQDLAEERMKEWKLRTGKILEFYKHPQYLNKKVIGTVCSFRDITERKRLEEQLLYQATHDSLTSLPNRVLLHDRIEQAISMAKRYGLYVGILFYDLDNFKKVNDELGHKAGDELLKLVAKRMKNATREADTVVRLGGDEFMMVIPSQTHEDNILTIVDKMFKLFEKPCQIGKHSLPITASIGVSIYPKDGQDGETLMKNADLALYRSKEMGRSCYQFYQKEFREDIKKKVQLSTSLCYALEKKELILHYQPLVELNSNKITGVEALIRWKHPTLGLIPPQVFIPLAEENGLILPIGEWVLRTACAQCKAWQEEGVHVQMSVNVSAHQLKDNNFVELVRKVLKDTGLGAKFLELEITENTLIENTSNLIKRMVNLKELGVCLTIDDFGTGYSSLSYLKYFPFDKLKIDKVFINEITSNKEDRCLVDAMISMTKKLGISVLAEGVESEDQVKYLQTHHGDQMQGYYFSRAVEAKECLNMLKKHIGSSIASIGSASKNK